MIKTETQIERDFYSFVKNSDLGKAIRGKVYRPEMRPTDATTEDLIVKFLAGLDEQVQTGVVIFNLYVPDIPYTDGRMVPDRKRIAGVDSLIRRNRRRYGVLALDRCDTDHDAQRGYRATLHLRKN